ncbi:hypothetical protein [Aeromonas enteropelogenes]|uniref:hypothetical protein n=1 Tax=Aeromonas enteropelogenes TaxID=29489 RepID=UPI003BA125FB
MSPEARELLEEYCEFVLNRPLSSCRPVPRNGSEGSEYLWPLNERFRPRIHQIRTVRYRKQFEKAADKALYDFVMHDADWSDLPLVVWRVLLERQLQMLTVCTANTLAGNHQFMYVPDELPMPARTKFAVAFWLYAMKLPFEVTDESALDIDSPSQLLPERLN